MNTLWTSKFYCEFVYKICASNMIDPWEEVIWFEWRKEKELVVTEKDAS